MSEVKIREYQPGDEENIVELLEEVFGGWPKADLTCSKIEYWKWKYVETSSNISIISVATIGDEIIGVNSQNVIPLQIGDKMTQGSYAGDLAVKRDYRGQGLSMGLITKAREKRQRLGIEYVYFVTQNPFLVKSYNKRYHNFPVPILNMARIQDIDLQLKHMPMDRAWLLKTGYQTLKIVNKLRTPRYPSTTIDLETKSATEFSTDLTQIIENNRKLKFLTNKNAEFLNWRYCDPRAGPYNIKIARENETPVGYIVSRINRYIENYPIGYIMDLLTNSGREEVANMLLESALNDLDSQKVNIVACMVPKGHPYERVYSSHGFIDSRKNLHLYTNLNEINQEYLVQNIKPFETHFCYGSIDSLPISIPNE